MLLKRPRIVVPTTAALAHGERLPPTSAAVVKTLSKLSRQALLSVVLEWLNEDNQPLCAPFLIHRREDEEDDEDADEEEDNGLYPAARSLDELRETYEELQHVRKGSRKDVVDRIVEGDWRHGLTLFQLGMADARYLSDHPASQKWIALRLARLDSSGRKSGHATAFSSHDSDMSDLPRFHAPSFLQNLQRELGPILRAHYYLTRHNSLPLTLLRVQIYDIPYNNHFLSSDPAASKPPSGTDRSKTIYVAFPDGAPAVYITVAGLPGQPAGNEGRNLRKIVLDALPKALSRPQARYILRPTSLTTRTLSSLVSHRGPGRDNAAPGEWSIFADGTVEGSPLEPRPSTSQPKRKSTENESLDVENQSHAVDGRRGKRQQHQQHQQQQKRHRTLAAARFGAYGLEADGRGIERVDVRMENLFDGDGGATDADAAGRRGKRGGRASNALGEGNGNRRGPTAHASGRGHGDRGRSPRLDEGEARDEAVDDGGWRPEIRVTFQGAHVFAGIRRLVEAGVVDGRTMPGWMTGEAGVSVGVVRNGRMLLSGGEGTRMP